MNSQSGMRDIQSHISVMCMHNLWSCSMMLCAFHGDKWMVCYLLLDFFVGGAGLRD